MSDPLISVSLKNNVQTITINRPKKKNAINRSMYVSLTNILNEAANDDNVTVAVLTGSGDYYSSGNDIKSFGTEMTSSDPFTESKALIQRFVEAFINFPKILIAIMNGPAVGIAATTLALCDVVYASEKAFLQTPFIKLGLSPEGCSTYTFPKLFGTSKATEMLLFGRKMSSTEAHRYGLISEIYSSAEMLNNIWDRIYELTTLPKNSLLQSKRMLKNFDKEHLLLANLKECNELEERWKSEEFSNILSRLWTTGSKL